MPIYLGDKEISKEYVDSYDTGLMYLGSNIVQGNVNYQVSDLGLVAYYDIANPNCYTSGSTTIYDLTANNNDMTINAGTVNYSLGEPGVLNLNDGFAVATSSLNLPSGSAVTQPDFSVGFWAKYANFGTATNGQNAFSFGSINNGNPGYIAMTNPSSSTTLYFGSTFPSNFPPQETRSLAVTSTFNTSSWYNIMVTYSGSTDVNASPGLATVYVNGQSVGSGPVSIVVSEQGCPVSLGIPNGYDVNQRGDGFNGRFAVGYIYNRRLNANEVLFNYNANKNRFGY